jgi:hypothetical protein
MPFLAVPGSEVVTILVCVLAGLFFPVAYCSATNGLASVFAPSLLRDADGPKVIKNVFHGGDWWLVVVSWDLPLSPN